MPQKKIRVYELARELGLTNKEAVDLCLSLGIGVKTHSSSIEDAQADRARRKADREGLRRDKQPDEDAPAAAASAPTAPPEAPAAPPAPKMTNISTVTTITLSNANIQYSIRRERPENSA